MGKTAFSMIGSCLPFFFSFLIHSYLPLASAANNMAITSHFTFFFFRIIFYRVYYKSIFECTFAGYRAYHVM